MLPRWLFAAIIILPPACLGTVGPVLMLGDSYTSANGGLDTILSSLLKSTGDGREVKAITTGGKDFAWHAKMLKSAGSPQEAALGKAQQSWGFVVLQDQSHVPAFCCNGPDTEFYKDFAASITAVQELDHAAEAHGAETVLLQTWGRRMGAPVPFLSGFEQMNEHVIQGYDMYASKITRSNRKPFIVPVGAAFNRIYNDVAESHSPEEALSTDNIWNELYSADGSHPSGAGSYLAACLLYATITKKSPIGLVGASGVSTSQAKLLQQRAHDAVFINATAVSAFKALEGNYSSSDPQVQGFVGEIRDGAVIWPVGIHTPLEWSGKQVVMFFHGEKLTGTLGDGTVTWSDGDIWKRLASGQQPALSNQAPVLQQAAALHPQPGVTVHLTRREPAVANHAHEARK